MATKLRLQRHGKKGKPFYHLVAADARAKRDGRFIEKIGTYNPNTNPATMDIDNERALHWLQVGAQPTDTVRAILSHEGILYKNHLAKGVTKGALTQDQADAKYDAWKTEKDGKTSNKVASIDKAKADQEAAAFAAEQAVNNARAKELAAANAPEEVVTEEATKEEE